MSSAASACSTAALTPSALNESCMCCSTPLNTYGSRSHCSKPPKEERELKSHGTAHCHPCDQGSTDLRRLAHQPRKRALLLTRARCRAASRHRRHGGRQPASSPPPRA